MPKKPTGPRWERIVAAAEMIQAGKTVRLAAEAAGVVERTVITWRTEPWWEEAMDEALGGGFIEEMKFLARHNIRDALSRGCPVTTRWILERSDEALRAKAPVKDAGPTPSAVKAYDHLSIDELEALLDEEPQDGTNDVQDGDQESFRAPESRL